MARDFTKNTANYMSLGTETMLPYLAGATALSIFARINADTFSTGSGSTSRNRIFSGGLSTGGVVFLSLHCSDADGTNIKVGLTARSATADTAQTLRGATTITGGAGWRTIGGTINYAVDAMEVFLNGASDGTSTPTFGATSLQDDGTPNEIDTIGSILGVPASSTNQFDGRIQDLAIWDRLLTAQEFADLHRGYSPWFFGTGLKAYWRLSGDNSPEVDEIGRNDGTINGTIAKAEDNTVWQPRVRSMMGWGRR